MGRAAAVATNDVSGAPAEVELIPAGAVPTRPNDRRPPFVNDDPEGVVAASKELVLDLPIDYEHQGEHARENGREAPAAGWIKGLFVRDGAVWGRVEWTGKAAAHLAAREYRYLSPVFQYDRASRRIRRIESAALTNAPAFFMRALARAEANDAEESEMDKEIARALGLAEDASEADILAAAKAAAKAAGELAAAAGSVKAIALAAGLAGDAAAGDVAEAVKTAKAAAAAGAGDPDPAKFVPRAEFDDLRGRFEALETSGAEARATTAVDRAIKAGKLTPASRDWGLGYAKKDPEGFDRFAAGQPAILPGGRVVPPGEPGAGGDTLTAGERAVCRATGVSEEKFIASRRALAAAEEEAA
ncbi:MAG: hypothetical protein OXC28_07170 [Defluviicoccus sp.]|nr:hypothetical protein [Defluviicoccus sp.]